MFRSQQVQSVKHCCQVRAHPRGWDSGSGCVSVARAGQAPTELSRHPLSLCPNTRSLGPASLRCHCSAREEPPNTSLCPSHIRGESGCAEPQSWHRHKLQCLTGPASEWVWGQGSKGLPIRLHTVRAGSLVPQYQTF